MRRKIHKDLKNATESKKKGKRRGGKESARAVSSSLERKGGKEKKNPI